MPDIASLQMLPAEQDYWTGAFEPGSAAATHAECGSPATAVDGLQGALTSGELMCTESRARWGATGLYGALTSDDDICTRWGAAGLYGALTSDDNICTTSAAAGPDSAEICTQSSLARWGAAPESRACDVTRGHGTPAMVSSDVVCDPTISRF